MTKMRIDKKGRLQNSRNYGNNLSFFDIAIEVTI